MQHSWGPKFKCIYVGDHENDLNASLAAGTISGVCTFGYGFKKRILLMVQKL
ncbi:MAG: hypothetical protein Ct9H90mP6_11280 [Gammaproteobacteria bacterium]|nr:MAG: hypothetical protein Ct9H90mP6_11280 [Gammaproteobacteria bacterium]